MSDTAAKQIREALGPNCRDDNRRALLESQSVLAAIDFVEFEILSAAPPPPLTPYVLHVSFLNVVPSGPFALAANLGAIRVLGGTRITGVSIAAVVPGAAANVVDIYVNEQGDFSQYLLAIGWSVDDAGVWRFAFDAIDRFFSVAPINFRPGCPIDFDCATACDCPPDTLTEPELDYYAKDYASFRQMQLDLVAQRNPTWIERSPADLGIALLELFAYEGDHLSYFQDTVANEAFLDTVRQRVSAKRHAKLVDYQMHDGRNAWTFVHVAVAGAGTIPPGTQLVTRISAPLRRDVISKPVPVPPIQLDPLTDDEYVTDPALAQIRVFETSATVAVDPLNNEIRLHTWGNEECCLARGATTAHVYAVGGGTAVRPPLKVGDYLLLEEVLGPTTGAAADADPAHRQVVQIERIDPDPSTAVAGPASDRMRDRLFLAAINPATGDPQHVTGVVPLASTLPLVEITWRKADALKFPLSVSALKDRVPVHRISVARANICLADHGRTIREPYSFTPPLDGQATFTLRLKEGPLTMQCQPDADPVAFPPVRERPDLTCDVREARPAVAIQASSAGVQSLWVPVPDLLSSSEFSRHFVADVDDVGRAVLRFGDGQYGERFANVDSVDVWYRVGNGRSGNIGADSIAHVIVPSPLPAGWPTVVVNALTVSGIAGVRNPLEARGGEDAELIEQVRQYAPAAFRAKQFRAVTEQDYKDAALSVDGVAGAVARFRWTGSWHTAFVGIDPADPDNVLTDLRGSTTLEPTFKQHVRDQLTRYRLAGYDLEIRAARYVPLDIALQICVKPGYFRGDVAHAVALALMPGARSGGAAGFFDTAKFTFGESVYLSRLYAAVENVPGVESSTVTVFQRHGRLAAGELGSAVLPIGPWEIARLDNDPNHMENGTLTITAGGGA